MGMDSIYYPHQRDRCNCPLLFFVLLLLFVVDDDVEHHRLVYCTALHDDFSDGGPDDYDNDDMLMSIVCQYGGWRERL